MAHFGSIIMGLEFNIVFEWADTDLHQLLYESNMRQDERPPDRLLAEASDLASAVDFLHKLKPKCYHMDLKPENIVVRPKRDNPDAVGRWMITDFGISVFHAETRGSKTAARRYRGAFQPPENDESWVKRTDGINEKGDIWALGCILSMVLAFAIGGKEAVTGLLRARAYDSLGIKQELDFFYVLVRRGSMKEMYLKRSVHRWLLEVKHKQNLPWVSECVKLIIWILRIDDTKRPDAAVIEETLSCIRQRSLGLDPRQVTCIPDLTEDSQNKIARRATEPLLKVTLPNIHVDRADASARKTLGSPRNLFQRRKDSAQQSDKETTPTTDDRLSTSTLSSERNQKQLANHVSHSSESTTGLKARIIMQFNLDLRRNSNRKAMALDIAISPSARHIMVCLKDMTFLMERLQTHNSTEYQIVDTLSACESVCISGPYYALQGVKKDKVSCHLKSGSSQCVPANPISQIVLQCADTDADASFATTVGEDQDSHLVLSIAISSRGIAAFLFQDSIRLLPAKQLVIEDRLGRSPYNYRLPKGLENEAFDAFAFSADGARLIAVGWKHYFVWDLDSMDEKHVQSPTIGKLHLVSAISQWTRKG
jgi:serine/threonine protein kinase